MTNVSPVSLRRPLALLAVLSMSLVLLPARAAAPSCDWTRYGRDNSQGFSQSSRCTSLNTANAVLMAPKWYFHAPDSMSASTTVSDGVIYEGNCDGAVNASDSATGTV